MLLLRGFVLVSIADGRPAGGSDCLLLSFGLGVFWAVGRGGILGATGEDASGVTGEDGCLPVSALLADLMRFGYMVKV